jgi:hypothetical protein
MFFIMTASAVRSSSVGLKNTNSVPGSCFTGTWPGGVYADLTTAGVRTELEVVPGLSHEFPKDFPTHLRRAVGFIFDA